MSGLYFDILYSLPFLPFSIGGGARERAAQSVSGAAERDTGAAEGDTRTETGAAAGYPHARRGQ